MNNGGDAMRFEGNDYEIDSTKLDIFLVSDSGDANKAIIYFIIDKNTKQIVGYTLNENDIKGMDECRSKDHERTIGKFHKQVYKKFPDRKATEKELDNITKDIGGIYLNEMNDKRGED
jgi:hypothetical protein